MVNADKVVGIGMMFVGVVVLVLGFYFMGKKRSLGTGFIGAGAAIFAIGFTSMKK